MSLNILDISNYIKADEGRFTILSSTGIESVRVGAFRMNQGAFRTLSDTNMSEFSIKDRLIVLSPEKDVLLVQFFAKEIIDDVDDQNDNKHEFIEEFLGISYT